MDCRAVYVMDDVKRALFEEARRLGFDRMAVTLPRVLERWRAEALARPDRRWADLAADPHALMPEAARVIVLARAYRPYRARAGEAAIDAYYLCSNAAHLSARMLADWLTARGARALAGVKLPAKAVASEAGFARYGLSGLTYMEGLGSRYALEALLTDAELPTDDAPPSEGFAPRCAHCRACVAACPTGALSGDGRVDTARCLRALPAGEPVDEARRALVGASLLGCDLCQRACPINAGIAEQDMPDELARALGLPGLLRGERTALAALIGDNYARTKRVQARACLIAANLMRRDCVPLIEALANDDHPAVRAHARWAAEQLRAR